MAERTSVRIAIIALACSIALALITLTAAAWTGAAVMMVLAVQALVSASHQALLLQQLTNKPIDGATSESSPDMKFLCFSVATLLYALGAGVALAKGTETLTATGAVVSPLLDVLALALAIGIQGAGLTITLALVHTGDGPPHDTPRTPKTPPVTALLIEHAGAIASLLIAALGVAFLALLEVNAADGAAATAIALVMALIATVMSLEVRKLLRLKSDRAHLEPELIETTAAPPMPTNMPTKASPTADLPPQQSAEKSDHHHSRKDKKRLKRRS